MEAESSEDQVEALGRSVVMTADRPPQSVVDLAKLSFEFRGMTVVPPLAEGDLVGARSTAVDDGRVSVAGRIVRWEATGRGLQGSVAGELEGIRVALQGTTATVPVELDDFGSFFVDERPAGPFRLLISNADQQYATPWER